MQSAKHYLELINQTLAQVEYPAWLPGLHEPIRYTMASGGKRLRSTLLLAMSDAFGGDLQQSVWPAVGVEMFHNFTLVHDDVMDHADMRRGRPTVHKKWDVNTAILSGDAMVSMAFKCMTGCPPECLPEVIDRFGVMTMQVYEGQQIDGDFEKEERVGFDDYLRMIVGKTSALIAYPCAIGAIIAGAAPEDVENVFNFGVSLGIAFQMQDDYLDVYGDPATFGKAIGGDILNDKKTWLHIMARDQDADGSFQSLLAQKLEPAEKIMRVTAAYDALNLREQGEKLVSRYTEDAISYLKHTTMGDEAKDWFIDYAHNLLGRNK